MDTTFDPDAFIRRIGQRLVNEFDDARAATTPGTVGSAMEEPVRRQLQQILPRGIAVGSGFVIDSYGGTSRQADIILYEQDICPVFSINGTPETTYYPCECVSAVGEVKSALDRDSLQDAFKKIASVKGLRRHLVRHTVPDPRTGQGWPHYRSYGNLHDGAVVDVNEKPAERGEVYGFVLAGDVRVQPESLATRFLSLTRDRGDTLSPNLLVTLSGITLSWGSITDERPGEVRKQDGQYAFVVAHGGPPRWKPQWSAQAGDHLRLLRGDEGFRFLIRHIREIYLRGRTSPVSSLDRYFAIREPQPSHAHLYPKDSPAEAVSAAETAPRPDSGD